MAQSRAESTRDTCNYGQYINQLPQNTIKVIRELERIQKKICRHKMSIMFNEICINEEMLPKYIYIYIYIYIYDHLNCRDTLPQLMKQEKSELDFLDLKQVIVCCHDGNFKLSVISLVEAKNLRKTLVNIYIYI